MSNQTFKLTLDAASLNLEKPITHARIVNQYVDVNDTMNITAPIDKFVTLVNQLAVVDIIATTSGSIYQLVLMSYGEVMLDAYFHMPPINKTLSTLELFTAYPPKEFSSTFWDAVFSTLKYRVITVYGDYTIQSEDCDRRTIIRVDSSNPCTITVPENVAPDNFTGCAITIRNVQDVFVTIEGVGALISPIDSRVLRRDGSTVTLIYAELNVWDLYGELP